MSKRLEFLKLNLLFRALMQVIEEKFYNSTILYLFMVES